jgi:hypothetical protein
MDISETLAPRSDQQNFDDYLAGPKILTVTAGALTGNAEQPLSIEVAEYPGRPYKPSKSMRRVIAAAWGTETDNYIGRRLKLVGNPNIRYGGKAVGGIEVEAVSHIDNPVTLALTETRGKKRPYTVQPLPDAPPARDFLAEANAAGDDIELLRAVYTEAAMARADTDTLNAIKALATPTEGS